MVRQTGRRRDSKFSSSFPASIVQQALHSGSSAYIHLRSRLRRHHPASGLATVAIDLIDRTRSADLSHSGEVRIQAK
jgi:hypothetical protein